MAFSKSLYYPWIDIRDEGWLKSAALYWDMIHTIVPESIKKPYSSKTARYLADEGILVPLHVHSGMAEIEDLVPDVITYLRSQEGMALLTGADRKRVYIHPEKLPLEIRRFTRMHPEKLHYMFRDILHDYDLMKEGRRGFIRVDDNFASFYMTLLASRLSEHIGAGLVTSSSLSHNLSLSVKADAQMSDVIKFDRHEYEWERYERRWGRRVRRYSLAQGMLVELMIEEIAISPDTPIKKIIKFREEHKTELGRFRKKVGEITSSLPEEVSLPAMRQYIDDLYINEVKPAMEELKKGLKSSRIKWLVDGWMKLAFISVGSSSMLAGFGLATGNALLVGAGISLVGSGILYNVDKEDSIRTNPYSYLMSIKNKIS